ncbi:MAG TPA: tetratricopeptide repeat protein [Tepidisphaeraceae bacterium]
MVTGVRAADEKPAAAPDSEFRAIEEAIQKDAPSADLLDRLYDFMEKYPKEPRSDRLQFWAGLIQQRRKFHNDAIKEFNFVVSDFPKSTLVIPALRLQANSYLAIEKPDGAAECFQKIVERKPNDFAADPQATGYFREAILWLAERAQQKKEIDEAVALVIQLPDRREAVTRIVDLYVSVQRFDDAIKAIKRLPQSDRMLAWRLMATTYAARPGSANLFKLFDEVLAAEKPSDAIDELIRHMVGVISSRGGPDRAKVLELVDQKYERLRRWAQYALCEMKRAEGTERLVKFIGDYNTGGDVEQCKLWIAEFYEAAGDAAKAREQYWRLQDQIRAHFLVAETYYGPRARTKDLPAGQNELSTIVKRFYSSSVSAEALTRRAELEAGPMQKVDSALATYRELLTRFPKEGEYPVRALMRMGELFRGQKKYDDALASYEKLIVQYADNGAVRNAWLQVGYTNEEAENSQRAIEVFKIVIRKFPRTREASVAHTRLETKYKVADTEVSD